MRDAQTRIGPRDGQQAEAGHRATAAAVRPRAMALLAAGLALTFAGAIAATAQVPPAFMPPAFTPADLVGEWDSGPCSRLVSGPGDDARFMRRRYLFTETAYSVRYTYFADEGCVRPLFTAHLSGRYALGETPAATPTARAADVYLDRVLLTVEAPELLPRVEGCGSRPWEVGVQQDVTEKGCLGFKPKAQCGVDHDLSSIAGGVFHGGFRTADTCTPAGRPTRVQSTGGARKLPAR